MSYRIDGTTIYLTRGDTFEAKVEARLPDDEGGAAYAPAVGDAIRFALKADYMDEKPLVVKDIPSDTMLLVLEPEDTKTLPFGKYVYDIQITYADGKVDTFITKGRLRLTEEVDRDAGYTIRGAERVRRSAHRKTLRRVVPFLSALHRGLRGNAQDRTANLGRCGEGPSERPRRESDPLL